MGISLWGAGGHDRSKLVEGRLSQKNVVWGIVIDNQIPDLQGLASLIQAEGGVQLYVALRAYPLPWETDHVVVVGRHFLYWNPHSFEGLLIEDINRTSLVHQGLHDGEIVYVDWYHHQIILRGIHPFEVIICECDRWHPWTDGHKVDLVHRPY